MGSRRREIEFTRLRRRLEEGDPFWPAQTAVAVLIESGALLWDTLVLLFAVFYWEFDGGGPVARMQHPDLPDFLFPQMDSIAHAPPDWRPGFVDYLYLSLTNATAFSPTDTLPLTPRVKLLMSVQSLASLVTIGLVVARAVNILS